MAEPLPVPAGNWDSPVAPDVSHLTTEDDQPVDNAFQDKQCDILTEALRVSWAQGRPFLSASDVAIFPEAKDEAAIVPDVLLSLGVEPPASCHKKENRSYFIWNFGKPPDIVLEIVSNKAGGEDTTKLERYSRIRVPYYVIYDPEQHLSSRPLRIFQLTGLRYVEKVDRLFPEIGLGLTVWQGNFDGLHEHWLRWVDSDGNLLATGEEERERAQRAEANAKRAEANAERAQAKAEQAEAEVERLREKLRALGVEAD